MAEIDELKAKLTNIRTQTQQIADNLGISYTAGEMTLAEIGNLLGNIEEHSGGGGDTTIRAAVDGSKITATVSLEA